MVSDARYVRARVASLIRVDMESEPMPEGSDPLAGVSDLKLSGKELYVLVGGREREVCVGVCVKLYVCVAFV